SSCDELNALHHVSAVGSRCGHCTWLSSKCGIHMCSTQVPDDFEQQVAERPFIFRIVLCRIETKTNRRDFVRTGERNVERSYRCEYSLWRWRPSLSPDLLLQPPPTSSGRTSSGSPSRVVPRAIKAPATVRPKTAGNRNSPAAR